MSDVVPVRRALLSVADKDGLPEFAGGLSAAGVRLISTGSTAAVLRDAGLEVATVDEVTGFPEMLGGRVKTLHPGIHAGILADRGRPEHIGELEEQRIESIDLVVVNLYPFERTALAGASRAEIVEQIDIGGPALIRAAAKNFASVGVVVEPGRYEAILEAVRSGGLGGDLRATLARAAFAHVALYDAAVAAWFASWVEGEEPPPSVTPGYERVAGLRYGENPHQGAALYRAVLEAGPLGGATVLQGKEMSFNNWLDTEAARALAASFEEPACVIVKHNNPCGAASMGPQEECYRAALASDPVSAFGGVVAFNAEVAEDTAEAIAEVFTEVVVAPGFSEGALAVLGRRKNLRVVRAPRPAAARLELRPIEGGALVQEPDEATEGRGDMKVVTPRDPTEGEWEGLLFAWKVAARVTSNAVVLARGRATVGVGAGQMSRVDAVELACGKAGGRARGAAMASDAFFPFRDGIDRAADAGVAAVIQPGGSVRDDEVIAAAGERGMAMVLTGRRHFRH